MIWDILSSPRAVLVVIAAFVGWLALGFVVAIAIGRAMKRLGDD